MRIQNLKQPLEATAVAAPRESGSEPISGGQGASHDGGHDKHAGCQAAGGDARHAVEIALLNARIQHLELVVETARHLMGSNQERLLRRLHELPREIAELSARLRQFDPTPSGGGATS